MQIILGVFFTVWFDEVRDNTDSDQYPFINNVLTYKECKDTVGLLEVVKLACSKCNTINFCLDEVRLPLSESRWTCRELSMIMKTPEFLSKAVFYLEGEVIDKDRVIEVFHATTEGELTFKDIKFK